MISHLVGFCILETAKKLAALFYLGIFGGSSKDRCV